MRCGGGVNHRMSLSDVALVKDNHVLAAGGVAAGVPRRCADAIPDLPVEVEVTTSTSSVEPLDAGADLHPARQHVAETMAERCAIIAGRAAWRRPAG